MDIQPELERIFADYITERGRVPEYARQLAKLNPDFLIKWFDTRRVFRGQGVFPEKYKELLMVATGAGRLTEPTIISHTKTAMMLGATQEEVLEAAMCTWLIGGMPSLIMCLNAFEKAAKEL